MRYFVFLLSCLFSIAQPQKWTLSACIAHGLRYHEQLQLAYSDERIAKQKVLETIAQGLPQIQASGDLKYFYEIPTTMLPAVIIGGRPGEYIPVQFGVPWNVTLKLEATQLLFSATYLVGVKAAKALQTLTTYEIKQTRQEVIAKIAKAYYTVLIQQQQLKLLENQLQYLDTLLQHTAALVQEGFVQPLDYDRLKVNYENLKSEYENLKQLVELSKMLLKFQMGFPIKEPIALADTSLSLEAFNTVFLSWRKHVWSPTEHPEYQKLIQLRRLRQLDVRRYRSLFLPTLVGFASIATQAQRTTFDLFDTKKRWFPIGVVGLQLNIPLFQGSQRFWKIQQAKLELKKTELQLQLFEKRLQLQQEQSLWQIEQQLKNIAQYERNRALARSVLETVQKKYKEGLASLIEVVQAQKDLREAEIQYFNALLTLHLSFVDYLQSLGVLETVYLGDA